ncbi:MAG: sigma factor, partial [Candidatus Lutibacillus vidarii]
MSHSRDDADALLADTVRREASSVVAFLYRLTGDFDVAEEAVQEALVSALHSWRRDGLPDVPG